MTKPLWNYLIDWAALALITSVLATGAVIEWRLPRGNGGNSLLGLTRHDWGEVHLWLALALVALVVVHLILHAKWIMAMTVGAAKGGAGRARVAAAAAGCVVLVGILAAAFLLPVRPGSGRGRESSEDHTGSVRNESATAGNDLALRDGQRRRGR